MLGINTGPDHIGQGIGPDAPQLAPALRLRHKPPSEALAQPVAPCNKLEGRSRRVPRAAEWFTRFASFDRHPCCARFGPKELLLLRIGIGRPNVRRGCALHSRHGQNAARQSQAATQRPW
ncbi:MAG: hypothetical protein U1E77_09090 [Inhella sp.]